MPTTISGGAVVPLVRWGWLSRTTIVASVRPPTHRDRPVLEWEIVSPSVSLSCSGAGNFLSHSLPLTARGMGGGGNGVDVHRGDEAKNQERRKKCPLPRVRNVKVDLRHFHRHCYKTSMLWFFVWKGLWSHGW
jgi:hypothetical protein